MNESARQRLFEVAHRGPYRPGQTCLVIHHPIRQVVGLTMTIASPAAWYVQAGPVPWEPEILRMCGGLEVQHVEAPGHGVATFPVRWMVPIGDDPDRTADDAATRPSELEIPTVGA